MDSNKKESLEEFLNSSVSSLDYLIDERTNLVEERSNQFVVSNSLELASSSDSSLIEDNPTLSTIQESFQESIQNTEVILSNPKRNLTQGQILAGFCRNSLGKPMSSIDDIDFQRIDACGNVVGYEPIQKKKKNYFK